MIYDYLNIACRRLALWGLLTLGVGLWQWIASSPGFQRGLGMQVAVWGAVCLVIALPPMVVTGLRRRLPSSPELEQRQSWILRIVLWLSVGLDLILAATGAWLVLSAHPAEHFQAGSGWGIIIHGLFLAVFDLLHALGVPRGFALPDVELFADPINETFRLEGGEPAVLLLHGFPGTPAEVADVGQAFHALGWSVHGLLLPGFGQDIGSLVYRRPEEWVGAVVDALRELKREHSRVVLAGFSMGGAVALAAAAREAPDVILLMAPFSWDEPGWKWLLVELGRAVLPTGVRPFGWVDFNHPEIRREIEKVQPGVDVQALSDRKDVRRLRVPLLVLEQVREMGKQAWRAAPLVQTDTYIVQGTRDVLSRPGQTRRLAKRIPGCAAYTEVDAVHHMTTEGSDGYEAFLHAVMTIAEQISTGGIAQASSEIEPEIKQPPL